MKTRVKRLDRSRLDRRVLLAGIGGVMAGSLFASKAKAGFLEPPTPGPPSPTGQTMDELAARSSRTRFGVANPCMPVEALAGSSTAVHSILESGSYTLTRNLQGQPGRHGIEILASDVDLDLCGFHILGPPPTGIPDGAGIYCEGENITIYDGSIRGFSSSLHCEHASHFILWDVTCMAPTTFGVLLGSNGECFDVDVHNCPGTAMECRGQGTLVLECGVWSSSVGISTATPAASNNLVLRCSATGCPSPFVFSSGCAHGPVAVVGPGDISVVLESRHPDSNIAY